MEIIGNPELVKEFANSGKIGSTPLSGVTQNPVTEVSSLMGGDSSTAMSPPSFVTETFFLAHVLMSFMSKKLE